MIRDPIWHGARGRECMLGAIARAVLIAGLVTTLPRDVARGASDEGAGAAPANLIVWVVDTDPRGVAIAIRDLAWEKYLDLKAHQGRHPGSDLGDAQETDLFRILSDLLSHSAQEHGARPFRLTWATRPEAEEPTRPPWVIEFKFARPSTLGRAWGLLWASRAKMKAGIAPVVILDEHGCVGPPPAWIELQKWVCDLHCDLAGSGTPVVILGPGDSDIVPALWLALNEDGRNPATFPWVVSTSATSSLLRFGNLPAEVAAGINEEEPWLSTEIATPWLDNLTRLRGYSAREARFASSAHQKEAARIFRAIEGVSRTFVQFAPPDDAIAREAGIHLGDVLGCRRVAIIYPDEPTESGGSASPFAPARSLFGEGVRRAFEREAANRGIDLFAAPLPAIPSAMAAKGDGSPEVGTALAERLASVLSFFDRSEVDAVGVFGARRERVLALVRERVPSAYVFTSEPDWSLEAPAPPPRALVEAASASKAPGYKLDGLLVFSGPQPPRTWIAHQMKHLGPLVPDGESFLANVEMYYSAHVVKRLVDLLQQGRGHRLSPPAAPTGDPTSAARAFAGLLHGPSDLGHPRMVALEKADFRGLGEDPRPRVLRIRDGRLGPMADGGVMHAISYVMGLGVAVLVGATLIRRHYSAEQPECPEPTLTLEWLGHMRSAWRELWRRIEGAFSEASPSPPSEILFYQRTFGFDEARPEASPSPAGPRGPASIDRPGLTTWGLMAMVVPMTGLLAALWLDWWLLAASVSFSPVPDGHSVLPSAALATAGVVLCAWMPIHFRDRLKASDVLRPRQVAGIPEAPTRHPLGLDRWWRPLEGDRLERFGKQVHHWLHAIVYPHLGNSGLEIVIIGSISVTLAALDAQLGFPVPGSPTTGLGFAKAAIFLGEVALHFVVLSTAWTFAELAGAAGRVLAGNADDSIQPREVDPEGLRRLGGIFIEVVAYALMAFALLLASRLWGLGMPRWRWDLPLSGGVSVPVGLLGFGIGLTLIVAYWWYCYQTFRGLIREVKNDRIVELADRRRGKEEQWRRYEASLREGGDPMPVPPFDWEAVSKVFDEERKGIQAIDERPWEPDDASPARRALLTALIMPLISLILGGWGGSFADPIKKIFSALLGGG